MTLDKLVQMLHASPWFQRLGTFEAHRGYVALKNLEAWRSDDPIDDAEAEATASLMAWLPSAVTEDDPFHGDQLKDLVKSGGLEEASREAKLRAYREALGAIGDATHPLLHVGPHDFTGSAKGAAAYAARAAALEVVAGTPGPWCQVLDLYCSGFWPCGRLPGGDLVVL